MTTGFVRSSRAGNRMRIGAKRGLFFGWVHIDDVDMGFQARRV